MSFKRSVFILALLVVMFSWGTSQAFASPVLIKLYLEDQSDYQKAKALNISACHRLDNLFIAEFEKSELKALENAGLTYQIIDEEPWSESYYVISESKRCEKVDLSQYGEILVQTGNFYFLKISDQGARSLAGKGYHIAKVFPHAIPLKYRPVPEEVPKSFLYDPSIDSLLSLISEDSLYAWTLRLQNFQTRYSYSDSIHAARQWIFDKFVSFGIDSVWLHYYYYDSPQYNVVATVVGTAQPDKVIVVGGHYDSVVYGGGTNPYVWAPGADDNGTGTVATLEIARIIVENPLPVTVMFVPFPQEEQGLIGSDYFCSWLYYHYIDVHLMLNADMIAHSVDSYEDVTIYGDASAMEFVNIMMEMANTYTYLHPYYGGQSSGSDHYSFYQWGYDALFSAEGDFFYGGWHKNYDIVDSLDFDYMNEVVKMDLATLITVARSFGPTYVIGDANGDEVVDIGDVIYLLSYLFSAGPAPDPLGRGDLNCNGEVNIGDVVFLLNYFFANGPEPPASC
jgi:hypothetical protein